MTHTFLHTELRRSFDLAARSVGDAQDVHFQRFVRALEQLIQFKVDQRLKEAKK
jgi:hypothetical protein